MRCAKRRDARGRPHGRAARQSRSPGKPRPFGFRRNGLICVVARLANRHELFAAPRRLASEAIAPETRLMWGLLRGSSEARRQRAPQGVVGFTGAPREIGELI